MHIRAMRVSDLMAVVKIHKIAFPDFFMTQMGTEFLQLYYRICIEFPFALNLVCEEDTNELLGFVVGFAQPTEFYAVLSKSRRQAFFPIIMALLRRPKLISRLLHNLKRINKLESVWGDVELASIAVGRSGVGVGRKLLQAFLNDAADKQHKIVYLTTDAVSNDSANRFYDQNNFLRIETFASQNRRMNVYQYHLPNTKE